MAGITKDEKRVNRAQSLYDNGLDKFLDIITQIDKDIPEICDILHGSAMDKPDEKYQITKERRAALKDQLALWKANVQNPEKVLAQINDGLKKSHGTQTSPVAGDGRPTIARFIPKAI